MKKSWWRSKTELDDDQKRFIALPPHGKYSLIGPPGSGKTNLLLLRAQFLAGSGEKNVLIITYTNTLAGFIRTGIGKSGLIDPTQVRTFHSWASSHIWENLGRRSFSATSDFDDAARAEILKLLKKANGKLNTAKLYSAIFVDEAQDLTADELEALLSLSDNVCICGDSRQGIYEKNGLEVAEKLKLEPHRLKAHFRIGQKVAHVADRLMPPEAGMDSLEATSNYNPTISGASSAKIHLCEDRDKQFNEMIKMIRIQLDAFKDDSIGVFCGKKDSLNELIQRFKGTDLSDKVCAHINAEGHDFEEGKNIHLMTIHAAKGTEFRAVHLFGAEDLAKFPMNKRRLGYTAITRAKTALNCFYTSRTNKPLENAFAEPRRFEIDDLFSED